MPVLAPVPWRFALFAVTAAVAFFGFVVCRMEAKYYYYIVIAAKKQGYSAVGFYNFFRFGEWRVFPRSLNVYR